MVTTGKIKLYFKRLGAAIMNKSVISETMDSWADLMSFLGIDAKNTPQKALSNATYYACLKILSEAIGKMPLRILKRSERGGIMPLRKHPLWKVLHDRPNKFMTATAFWSLMEYNRNHYGNAYAWIVPKGKTVELYPLEPHNVEVWYDNASILSAVPAIWYRYTAPNGEIVMIHYESILHVRSFATDNGLTGKAVRTVLAETIDGNLKAQKMLNTLYSNGFTNKAIVQYTEELSDELRDRFLAGIQRFIKGEYKEKGIDNLIPVPYGTKVEPLSNVKLADSQFLELKQYSAIQIASAFGIKPVQIGDLTKASYASAEAQQLSFLVDTLLYIVKHYEEEITFKLLDGSCYSKFNVDVILRADYKNKITTLKEAVNGTIYSVNEAREKCDLDIVDGGDVLICNGNAIPLHMIGQQYANAAKGGENNDG